jgi:hypothetical protein
VPTRRQSTEGLAFQASDDDGATGKGKGVAGKAKGKGPRRVNTDGSMDSELQKNEATHYSGNELEAKGKHSWTRYLWRHLTLRGVMEKLLRKTVARNTWMYISDMDCEFLEHFLGRV